MPMSPRLLRPRSPGGFSPKNVANLEVWFDAADSSTITTVSGAVSEWRSKAGGTRNLTQSTAANRPALTANYFSGRSAITFDGSNDSLFATSLPSIAVSPISVFVAVDFLLANTVNDRGVLSLSNSSVAASYSNDGGLNIAANSTGRVSIRRAYEAYARAASGGLEMETTAAQTAQPIGKKVIGITADGTNGFLYDNGSQHDTQAATVSTATTRMYVGSLVESNNPSLFANCVICEVLIYTRAVNATERGSITKYLGNRWGITVV